MSVVRRCWVRDQSSIFCKDCWGKLKNDVYRG